MAKSSEKDREAAKYMKDHPGRFPDSAMRPWPGNGADLRKLANQMSAGGHQTAVWDRGMLGGVICARLGLGSANIPDDLASPALSKAA